MMKKLCILFCGLFLAGCDTASTVLFQDRSSPVVSNVKNEKVILASQSVEQKTSIDFYGRPIYTLTLEGKKTDYGQGLYHALSRSMERNPRGLFLIVGYSKDDSSSVVESEMDDLNKAVQSFGVPADHITTKVEQLERYKTYPEIRVYER